MPIVFSFTVAGEGNADMVGGDVVVLELPREVVINRAFQDVSSYTISVVNGVGELSVRRVLVPTNSRTTSSVVLYVDRPTKGTRYRITTGALTGRDGSTVAATTDFIGRYTKLESMLAGIPSHVDTRPDGTLRSILSAISIEDDRIGGSRDDFL